MVPLPEDVIVYLGQCFDSAHGADENTEGYKRNKDLRDTKEVTYQQLKRMKNWFDEFNGHENELPHILNGGHYVKGWINNTLDSISTNMRGSTEINNDVTTVGSNGQTYNDTVKFTGNSTLNTNTLNFDNNVIGTGVSLNIFPLKTTQNSKISLSRESILPKVTK